MNTRILQAPTCCNGVAMGQVPGYLVDLYTKLSADAGDAKLVVFTGWSDYDSTDLSLVAPATFVACLEEHIIAQIPKGEGGVEIKLKKRGRVERQFKLVHTAGGELKLETLPFVVKSTQPDWMVTNG